MGDNSKCAVLVPVARTIEPETEDSLRILASRGYMVRLLRGCSMVDLARATLATEALADGAEETMWIDSDQTFNPDDVDRLRSHGLPFVVGLYVQKGPKRFAGMFPPDIGRVTFGKGGGLYPMTDVGFGFTYVRREVYDAVRESFPESHRLVMGGYQGKMLTPYFLPIIAAKSIGPTYLSEDYSFTDRAKAVGFHPMADTTIKLGHIGRKEYTWDDLTWTPEKQESLEIMLGVTDWKFPADVRGWLTDEEGAGLVQLARDKDVLEVGSYCGRSSICIGQTAKSLTCIDPFDCRDTPGEGNTYPEFAANLERFGVKARVHRTVFADAPLNGDRFDLVFIDAAHDEASVSADAERATKLLRPDGLLAFHDARPQPGHHDGGWHPGVTHTVNRLCAEGATMVRTCGTIAVIKPSSQKGVSGMSHELYAKIGQLQCENDTIKANYSKLLKVFAEVLQASRPTPDADEPGRCNPLRILINLSDEVYEWSPQGQRPAMPSTINGVPVCVMAPDVPPDDLEPTADPMPQLNEPNPV